MRRPFVLYSMLSLILGAVVVFVATIEQRRDDQIVRSYIVQAQGVS